jgi:hypothetical protein
MPPAYGIDAGKEGCKIPWTDPGKGKCKMIEFCT